MTIQRGDIYGNINVILLGSAAMLTFSVSINLSEFPFKLQLLRKNNSGILSLMRCNETLCLDGINWRNGVAARVSLGMDAIPTVFGFLDKRLYIVYRKDEEDLAMSLSFNHYCKMTTCPVRLFNLTYPHHRISTGALDPIGIRIFLVYKSLSPTSRNKSAITFFNPGTGLVERLLRIPSGIDYIQYDQLSSTLYYTNCRDSKCSLFQLKLDLSFGFPAIKEFPRELSCVSAVLANGPFLVTYPGSSAYGNLYFYAKPGSGVDMWSSELQSCFKSFGSPLPPTDPKEVSQIVRLNGNTAILMRNSSIVAQNTEHRKTYNFGPNNYLISPLLPEPDYKFDEGCLLPDLLKVELVMKPMYRNLAVIEVRRVPAAARNSTEWSLEEYYRSKCDHISLPRFTILTSFITQNGTFLNGTSAPPSPVAAGYSSAMGKTTVIGLKEGLVYSVHVVWNNRYTRHRQLEEQKVTGVVDWNVESFPQLRNLSVWLPLTSASGGSNKKTTFPVIASVLGVSLAAVTAFTAAVLYFALKARLLKKRTALERGNRFEWEKDIHMDTYSNGEIEVPSVLELEAIVLQGVPQTPQSDSVYSPFLPQVSLPKELAAVHQFSMANIIVSRELGSGTFGTVYQAESCDGIICGDATVGDFAMKTMGNIFELIAEAKAMAPLSHPNIVALYGICLELKHPSLAMEYLAGGDLLSYLRRLKGTGMSLGVTEQIAMTIDIASALTYLAEHKIVHRDVAARNCLLSHPDHSKGIVKLGDFGMTRPIPRDYYRLNQSRYLPIRWLAPESINQRIFTTKTDIWSFGILMWEITTIGETPYSKKTDAELVDYIRRGNHPDTAKQNPQLVRVMKKCWELDLSRRIEPSNALEHLEALKSTCSQPPLHGFRFYYNCFYKP